jgi:hypothetical protein
MSPICREHGHFIFMRSSTSSSYLHPSYLAFSSQTNTFVQINFSNLAVCYVMVCLQQPTGRIWVSTEMQDFSKQFHCLANDLHHLFSSGNTSNSQQKDKSNTLLPPLPIFLVDANTRRILWQPFVTTSHVFDVRNIVCLDIILCVPVLSLFFCIYTVVTTEL